MLVAVTQQRSSDLPAELSLNSSGRMPFRLFRRSAAYWTIPTGRIIFVRYPKMAARQHTFFDVCIVAGILVILIAIELDGVVS